MVQAYDEANVNVTNTQEDVDSKDGLNANNERSVAYVNWQYTNTGDEFHNVYNDEDDYSWDKEDYNGT